MNDYVVPRMRAGMTHYHGIQALFYYRLFALEQFHSRLFDTIFLVSDTPMQADQM